MSSQRRTHYLTGCSPIPLAGYLKALGILRIVAEQFDPLAEGWWEGEVFVLRSDHDENSLIRSFLEDYRPTPLIGPWGARSGFFLGTSEKSAREALLAIEKADLPRLKPFCNAIVAVRKVLSDIKLSDKAETPEEKRRLMMHCRSALPDELLPWLDATYLLLDTETKYPPLLGTGGNEGSGSYMSGFAQQIDTVIIQREWDHALRPALLGANGAKVSSSQTPGHFSPEAAGGPNAASMSAGDVATNPWDYLLLLEGTLIFASASVKRMEQREGGILSYPFCVRQAGVGYGSSASEDETNSRAEIWLPLWNKPTSLAELATLFSEGRAQVGGRPARNGVDFARSLAGMGTDRGISEFQRFGFQQRNGLSYFAVPLGRFRVTPQPQVNLLAEPALDHWLDSFRRAASAEHAPSSARRASRRIEKAILELCQKKGAARLQEVLIALGEAEGVLAISGKWRAEAFQRPVPFLSPQWLVECDDGSVNFRLAASLAGLHSPHVGGLRQHLEPVDTAGRWPSWEENGQSNPNLVWTHGDLESNLIAVLHRRAIEAVRQGERTSTNVLVFPGESRCYASLGDVAAFLGRRTDDRQIADLMRGLLLLDWGKAKQEGATDCLKAGDSEPLPDATYGLLKLCHSPYSIREVHVRLEPSIARLAAAGRLPDASQLAARRLLGSSLPPAFRVAAMKGTAARRVAAALLFPLNCFDTGKLAEYVLKPQLETV